MIKTIFLIILFAPFFVSAGSSVGNGGIGIVCEDQNRKLSSVNLVDYIEGLHLYDYTYNTLTSQQSPAQLALQRLNQISNSRANAYAVQYLNFMYEAKFKSGTEILDPEDSFHYINLQGCVHKTLILQVRIELPGTPKYLINADYFYLLSKLEKEMLLFHEIIYREAIYLGHENSRFTRAFTAALFSDQWKSLLESSQIKYLMDAHEFPKEYLGKP